ncbi:L-asparaginase II [Azospirillaceae bacterium]
MTNQSSIPDFVFPRPRCLVSGWADLSGPAESPVMVETTRGSVVESWHHGHAVVVDAGGRIIMRWGNIGVWIYPRSAIKPIQSLSMVEANALSPLGLGEPELALACSSHSGEFRHIRLLTAWMNRLRVSLEDLECPAAPPLDHEAAEEIIRRNEALSPLHNNCSGKHLGMISLARAINASVCGYSHYDHPAQQKILQTTCEMTGLLERSGFEPSHAPWAPDGCGAPSIAMPLYHLALGMARLADPRGLSETRIKAIQSVRRAWAQHPYLIAGRNRFDTVMMQASPGHLLMKTGAEGVACAVLPRRGLGVALKIEDGSSRACHVAMAALLYALRTPIESRTVTLTELLTPAVLDGAMRPVGVSRPAAGWLVNAVPDAIAGDETLSESGGRLISE